MRSRASILKRKARSSTDAFATLTTISSRRGSNRLSVDSSASVRSCWSSALFTLELEKSGRPYASRESARSGSSSGTSSTRRVLRSHSMSRLRACLTWRRAFEREAGGSAFASGSKSTRRSRTDRLMRISSSILGIVRRRGGFRGRRRFAGLRPSRPLPPDRLRQFGHEPQGDRQLVELKVRPQEGDRLVDAGLAGNFRDLDTGLAEGELRLDGRRGRVVGRDVVRDPLVEEEFDVFARGEAADLVPHDRLEVVGETGHREDVGELRRETRVRVREIGVVFLRLLGRLPAEERRVVGVLAVNERDEAEVRELLLAAVGDRDLGRTLQRHVAFVGLEGVRRKPLYEPAALHAADRDGPVIEREGLGQARPERVGGVSPKVLLVVLAVHVLFEIEGLSRDGVRAIRETHERVGEGEPHVAGVLRVAERAPLRILGPVEDLSLIHI